MTHLEPNYTAENCRFSAPLQWSVSLFWRDLEPNDDWRPELAEALEPDGIRLVSHNFVSSMTSQIAVSTLPNLSPETIVQRCKGRLYRIVRDRKPKPFKGNYSIRSIGRCTRETVEAYVQDQLEHHKMADLKVQARLQTYQLVCPEIDLSKMQKTSHGAYWYNLHVVLVHRERWCEVRDDVLSRVKSMLKAIAKKHGLRLSKAAILPDHVHVVVGCPSAMSPIEIALSFLNNLSYVHGMKPIYQFGGFIGTIGEYTNKAIR